MGRARNMANNGADIVFEDMEHYGERCKDILTRLFG